MKKFLSVLLAVLLIISIMPMGLFSITASAATSGKTGNCTWSLDGTVLTISGNGKMQDYSYSGEAPWGIDVTKAIIKAGVKYIGQFAFSDCALLKSLIIPDSISSINHNAFSNCKIRELYIAEGSKEVTSEMIVCRRTLEKVIISDTVTSIGELAFEGCTGLTSIEIPNSITSIGRRAFWLCTGLTDVTIPNNVISIGERAFDRCTGLINITISNSVVSIGNSAFSGCLNLSGVHIKILQSGAMLNSVIPLRTRYIMQIIYI